MGCHRNAGNDALEELCLGANELRRETPDHFTIARLKRVGSDGYGLLVRCCLCSPSHQSLSACYRIWKARGRPASRRTSSTVDVLALRHSSNGTVRGGGAMAKNDTASKRSAEVARAYARYTINLQRAFGDLVADLERAYG